MSPVGPSGPRVHHGNGPEPDEASGPTPVRLIPPRPSAVHIRDSKNADGPALTVSPAAWAGSLGRIGR
ncbi:hypothetical protein GCM10010415_34850 [Streptomyces atrovirens]|uniref:DUF397 domain-containing protein n=1 Tax=Streptomyces atrovirens TaxID=285556 RepID=A0ABW0DYV5_9ACTN